MESSNLVNQSYDDVGKELASSPLNWGHHLSHNEFIESLKNGSIEYSIVGEPSKFLLPKYKKIFNFLVAFYWLSPFIVIPVCAYLMGNWWLCFGILFSIVGSITGSSNLSIYLGLFCIGEACTGHWHLKDYDDFFYLCMLWGYFWFKIADESQYSYARFELLNNSHFYYSAVNNNKILITLNQKKL